MRRMTVSACVDAAAAVVWAHLSRLDQIHVWTDLIHDSRTSGACSMGVGAERSCEFGRSRSNHEHVIAWDEGRSFAHESTDAPMMRLSRSAWSVTPMGERAQVRSEAEMEFKGGLLGRILGWLLVPVLARLLPNPLTKFKFWAESGRPYEGKASPLPVPVAFCL